MRLDPVQNITHLVQQPFEREGERIDRAFHALEQVHPHEVYQALFAVDLFEDRSAGHNHVILAAVLLQFVREDVLQRSVGTEVQAADVPVDLLQFREQVLGVDVGLDVDGLGAFRKLADLAEIVILLDVLAGTGDGEQVEHLEVVKIERFEKALSGSLLGIEPQPGIEPCLGLAKGLLDTRDAVVVEGVVLALGDERNLILQVVHAAVDGRGGEHQHLRLDAGLDDLPHEPGVTGQAVLARRVVSEVVRFIDDNQVVVAPVQRGQVDLAGMATVAGKVCVVQDVEVEPVGGEKVAPVIDGVERPVFPELLRTQHKDAVVAQLVVLDDGQSLEGLSEADAVGNDAAVVFLDLIDGTQYAVPLKAVELAPDEGIFNARSGLDDLVFLKLAEQFQEDVVEREEIDQFGRPILVKLADLSEHGRFYILHDSRVVPNAVKPAQEARGFVRRGEAGVHFVARRRHDS